jgi:hypothetical protein
MQSLYKKVDALFAHCEKADSPGCALAVIDQGQIVYQCGYGMADIKKGEKITAQYAGCYRCRELDKTYRLYQMDGELVVYLGGEKLVLGSAAFDRFSAGGFDLQFQRDAAGAIQRFILSTGRAQGMVCTKQPARGLIQRKRRRLAVVSGRR